VTAVIDVLEASRVPYMVVGSLSSNIYGIPRSTKDAGFVVQLGPITVQDLAQRLGPGFQLEPQMSFETVTATTPFIIHAQTLAFRIELFLISDDAHDQERCARCRRATILGRQTFVPSPEDVVIQKIRWSQQGRRAKDIDDARGVVAVQRENLDWPYVERWCDQHGTRGLLDEIRRSTPII
jgi:hypothetical protein